MQEVNFKKFIIFNLLYLSFCFRPQVCIANSSFRICGFVPCRGSVRNIILLYIYIYIYIYIYSIYTRTHTHTRALAHVRTFRDKSIIYNKPTRCNSGSIVFIKNYKYALHVSDARCICLQEHYKL